MARRKQFGDLTRRSQDRIAREGSRFGLTRRQARERYNRGTFNPLSRNIEKRVPQRAPYYPVSIGQELREAAWKNFRAKMGDRFRYNDDAVREAIYQHGSEDALRRMANASEDELETWAESQKRSSYKGKHTPEWLRDLGWRSDDGKWHNIFWYH